MIVILDEMYKMGILRYILDLLPLIVVACGNIAGSLAARAGHCIRTGTPVADRASFAVRSDTVSCGSEDFVIIHDSTSC